MKFLFLRLVTNFLLASLLILLFRNAEWITFTNPPGFFDNFVLNDIVTAGVIGFVIFIIGEIAGIAYQLFLIVTCCVGCLLFPVFSLLVGYAKLIGTQMILEDWFTFDTSVLRVSIISLAIGIIRVPAIKERKKVYIQEKTRD